jgi:hypothetical protein
MLGDVKQPARPWVASGCGRPGRAADGYGRSRLAVRTIRPMPRLAASCHPAGLSTHRRGRPRSLTGRQRLLPMASRLAPVHRPHPKGQSKCQPHEGALRRLPAKCRCTRFYLLVAFGSVYCVLIVAAAVPMFGEPRRGDQRGGHQYAQSVVGSGSDGTASSNRCNWLRTDCSTI